MLSLVTFTLPLPYHECQSSLSPPKFALQWKLKWVLLYFKHNSLPKDALHPISYMQHPILMITLYPISYPDDHIESNILSCWTPCIINHILIIKLYPISYHPDKHPGNNASRFIVPNITNKVKEKTCGPCVPFRNFCFQFQSVRWFWTLLEN